MLADAKAHTCDLDLLRQALYSDGKIDRIDPKTDGRPDSRTVVRENAAQLGDLRNDFDFSQAPRPPEILPGGIVVDGK